MVLDYYNLKEQPFGVTPDPGYLYLGATHREALASLLYGVTAGRGFMALIAKPGMGKTTLLFQLLQKLEGKAKTAFIFQTLCTPRDFLRALLADLGVEDCDGDLVRMHSKLNELLVRQSALRRRFVVVIDEAQNLDDSVLEVVRMLSNFETPAEKLMQIVLAGQPQLADKLASSRLVQLRQRVSILSRLQPFNAEETKRYIDRRLSVAGRDLKTPLFSDRALLMIAEHSEGIPRNINNICFNALSVGCVLKQPTIGPNIIGEVLNDLDVDPLREDTAVIVKSAGKTEPKTEPTIAQPARSVAVSPRRAWLPRYAVAAALLLGLSWTLVRANRGITKPAGASVPVFAAAKPIESPVAPASAGPAQTDTSLSVPAPSKVSMPVSVTREKQPVTASPANAEPSRSIRVVPNETLYRISVQNFGKYNREILGKILELNPWLGNPDYIKTGQNIRIPVNADSSEKTQDATKQTSSASAAEVEKP
jgi:general secretion pathway protein A